MSPITPRTGIENESRDRAVGRERFLGVYREPKNRARTQAISFHFSRSFSGTGRAVTARSNESCQLERSSGPERSSRLDQLSPTRLQQRPGRRRAELSRREDPRDLLLLRAEPLVLGHVRLSVCRQPGLQRRPWAGFDLRRPPAHGVLAPARRPQDARLSLQYNCHTRKLRLHRLQFRTKTCRPVDGLA